jgi:dipeptidyl aminopeptidase/acylaminoacyl peptidase
MRPVRPEDVISFKQLSDTQITPDGALIAFVRTEPVKEYKGSFKQQIWAVPAAGGEAHPYTSGLGSDSMPRWSPDGQTLAFVSDREEGRDQIYLLSRSGGEARRLTSIKGDIHELEWSPDGATLAFLMSDPEPEDATQRRERGDDVIEFEKHHRWWRVWTVDVAHGEARQITSGDVQVWEFAWRPDGGFVLITSAEPYEWSWFLPRLAKVGPEGGEPEVIYRVPEKCFACPQVSPDGTQVAFLSAIWSDRGTNGGDVLLLSLEGGKPRVLTQGYNGDIWWMQWSPDGSTLDCMAYEQGEAAIVRIDVASGARETRWRGPVAFSESFSSRYIAQDGTIALVRSDPCRPQEVWITKPTTDTRQPAAGNQDASSVVSLSSLRISEWTQLTNIHAHAAELAIGETRTIHWESADGLQIQGQLILPVGYQEGQRVPLLTWVHGGPAWLYTHTYQGGSRGFQMYANAGMAVFMPNPRGSVGWGVPFTESNIGDFGGKDYQDIISGIEYLVAQGIADSERLGIGGWSYGGFMAAWAITQTNQFKAAVVGAAIINWRSFHGAAHIGSWDRVSLRANPYEHGGTYDKYAPITYVERVNTPTLVVHGAEDRIVPVDQGYEFIRALKDRGVPVEMVVYPREGHGINERLHQLDRLSRWLEWFKRHLA